MSVHDDLATLRLCIGNPTLIHAHKAGLALDRIEARVQELERERDEALDREAGTSDAMDGMRERALAAEAALAREREEVNRLDRMSADYSAQLVAAEAALAESEKREGEWRRKFGRAAHELNEAEAALAHTQHLHYLAEIEARDLRAALADMRRALARVEQMALRGESGIISVVRRALAAADSGTAATCGKCRHPEHDPGECGFNVGTGYFGSVPCWCGTDKEES